jgi:superfamily II DNA/RNA helicase
MNINQLLLNYGIKTLNPLQLETLNAVESNREIVITSPTGSGKTLAFLLSCIQLIDSFNQNTQVLIVAPTRELVIQIEEVFKKLKTNLKVTCCYGGHEVKIEEQKLINNPPQIIIATPGRLVHHLKIKNISLNYLKAFVIDEFDKCLEFGFDDEMSFVCSELPHNIKKILTSATNLSIIPEFIKLTEIKYIDFVNSVNQSKPVFKFYVTRVEEDDKSEALALLLSKLQKGLTIVFCNHRETVDRVSEQLRTFNFVFESYHGGMEQNDRVKALIKFRNSSASILVTTDLASRGIDILDIDNIIHYQLPLTQDVLTHRNGRTARMQADGSIYFLLDKNDDLPSYINNEVNEYKLPRNLENIQTPIWNTLFITAGKINKISKVDIVGAFMQKATLNKNEIGRIDVLDKVSYVAVLSQKCDNVISKLNGQKIKGVKVKIGFAD